MVIIVYVRASVSRRKPLDVLDKEDGSWQHRLHMNSLMAVSTVVVPLGIPVVLLYLVLCK